MSENKQKNEELEGLCLHGNFIESCEVCKKENGNKITKEIAQQELVEKFKIKDTGAFRLALNEGDIDTARQWLVYIEDNQEQFPQYHDTWENWLKDRKQEIAQQELFKKFGMKKTSDFKNALEKGYKKRAQEWLEYIVKNRDNFPQYNDSWFEDRDRELG